MHAGRIAPECHQAHSRLQGSALRARAACECGAWCTCTHVRVHVRVRSHACVFDSTQHFISIRVHVHVHAYQVHRTWVVNNLKDMQVIGVVSLTDIIQKFSTPLKALHQSPAPAAAPTSGEKGTRGRRQQGEGRKRRRKEGGGRRWAQLTITLSPRWLRFPGRDALAIRTSVFGAERRTLRARAGPQSSVCQRFRRDPRQPGH